MQNANRTWKSVKYSAWGLNRGSTVTSSSRVQSVNRARENIFLFHWRRLSSSEWLSAATSHIMDILLSSIMVQDFKHIHWSLCTENPLSHKASPAIWMHNCTHVTCRVSFRLAVLVYRCLHGSAPGYLASDLQHVSHLNARRRLRSSTTSVLVAPRTVRSTIGDRTFPATAASVWNSLPESVRSSPSLQDFRSRLKTVTSVFSLIVMCPCSLRT